MFGCLLAGGLIRVDVRLNRAGLVYIAGIDLKPVQTAFIVGSAHKRGATHVGDLLNWLTPAQAVGNFHQGALGVTVQQQVALGIDHHATAYLVAPVIVVGNAAQAAFNAAQNDRHILEGLAAALAVHQRRTVRPFAPHVTRGVGVIGANFAVCRVAVDHAVHVAGGHAPEQVGFAQHLESFGALPVRLGDDAHAKTLGLQHAANHCHAKAGVVYISITRDQHHVTTVPAKLGHFRATHRQKGGGAQARCPELAVAVQGLGGTRKEGDVNKGVHGNLDNGKGASVRFQGFLRSKQGYCQPALVAISTQW